MRAIDEYRHLICGLFFDLNLCYSVPFRDLLSGAYNDEVNTEIKIRTRDITNYIACKFSLDNEELLELHEQMIEEMIRDFVYDGFFNPERPALSPEETQRTKQEIERVLNTHLKPDPQVDN